MIGLQPGDCTPAGIEAGGEQLRGPPALVMPSPLRHGFGLQTCEDDHVYSAVNFGKSVLGHRQCADCKLARRPFWATPGEDTPTSHADEVLPWVLMTIYHMDVHMVEWTEVMSGVSETLQA